MRFDNHCSHSTFALAVLAAGVFALTPLAGAVEVTLGGGDNGTVSAPIRFAAPDADEAAVLSAKGPDGAVHYAQRDGGEYAFFAPAIEAGKSLTLDFSPAVDAPVRVLCNMANEQIKVTIDGQHFTTYHYSRDYPKPFLWPVLMHGKLEMTRAFPMSGEEGGKYPNDHHHHRSWWVSYGEVNDSNFWHESADDQDQQRTEEILEVVSGPVFGKIRARNNWNDQDGKREVTEEREYVFYAGDGINRYTDMRVSFTAEDGEVVFHQTKEGGICSFRMHPNLDEKDGGTGKMTNSEGQSTTAECWGQPARWIDYAGVQEGQKVGIAVLDHPENLRHPTRWHIRDYGLYGANCFGLSDFTDGKENGDYTIADGDTLTFNYRVLIHEGDTAEADLEPKWQAYANPTQPSVK